jgi:hypothetical protein
MGMSDETRKKMSESRRAFWASLSPEKREELSAKQRKPRPGAYGKTGRKRGTKPVSERRGMEVECANGCGKKIWRSQYLLEQFPNAFCSRSCSAQYQSRKARLDPDNQVVCVNPSCGKTFYRQKSREKYNNGNHYCSRKCRDQHYAGERHHNWQGGRFVNEDGYVMVAKSLIPPEFLPMLNKGQKTLFEHRLVMAMHLGRPLESWEVVHHVDHNRSNNDISNLELHSAHEHAGITASERKLLARIRELEAAAAKLLIDP